MDRYDADIAPDPAAWLALDPDRRHALVRAHHRGRVLRIHPKGFDERLHAALHVMVEDQIAANEPPVTRRTLERLQADGLRRHAALHAVIDQVIRNLARGEAYDPAVWEADLDAVDAATWLGDRMRKELGREQR